LKALSAPKHKQQIGNNYVLWFESSNSYIVISTTAYVLLTCYYESKDRDVYIKNLQKQFDIPEKEANSYFDDFSGFLKSLNSNSQIAEFKTPIAIPNPNITRYYAFGDSQIAINYGSDRVSQLINPYLQHASVKECSHVETAFDIFSNDNLLYLFKNKKLIGSYQTSNFHFLQGKFAMELVTSIYNNTESDWLGTFHASTICNDKEAIMIIGDSGNGKSTLSAVLMSNGYDLLADDFTPMLAKNQHLYRFPAAISIKKGAFALIGGLFDGFNALESEVSTSKHTTVKYLPPSKPFKSSKKHFECRKLVMVKYTSDVKSELRECSPEKILQTFIPDSWISPKPEHSRQFLNWLKGMQFYELTYSDNDFAVAKFKELFEL